MKWASMYLLIIGLDAIEEVGPWWRSRIRPSFQPTLGAQKD